MTLYSVQPETAPGRERAGRPATSPKEAILARTFRLTARFIPFVFPFLLAAAASAQDSSAQESGNFSIAVLGSLGGSLDVEPGDALDNTGYQINLGMWTEPRTQVVVRAGKLGLDKDAVFGQLTDADLTYATIGGEYRSRAEYYDSGVFMSLGAYRLDGNRLADGRERRETAPGLAAGVTGEFRINRWLGVLAEFAGHYVNFDDAQVFVTGHAGVVVRF